MWIRLLEPCALFFPAQVEPVGSVHSVGDPRGRKLVREQKAQVVFPGSGDPDDVAQKRQSFKQANGRPLWDERKRSVASPQQQPSSDPQAAMTVGNGAAGLLSKRIAQQLGPRAAAAWRKRERQRFSTLPVQQSSHKAAAMALARTVRVTRRT